LVGRVQVPSISFSLMSQYRQRHFVGTSLYGAGEESVRSNAWIRAGLGIAIAGFLAVLPGGAALLPAQVAARQPAEKGGEKGIGMKIVVTSVPVNDQEQALKFYTEVLGFAKKTDIPVGGGRWLTVVSPEQPDGPELLLEPIGFPPAKTYQKALFDAGIPWTSFAVTDIESTCRKLKDRGVVFRSGPTRAGQVTVAVFEDTCGNLIQIAQPH
jgi:catechol 2,3-dioxygenase-like lactoylglutathione lyase family enzyme